MPVSCECCDLSGRELCHEGTTGPEDCYRACIIVIRGNNILLHLKEIEEFGGRT
jgi:hypothetical protein